MTKNNILLSIYSFLIFAFLLASGYTELIDAILNMTRNTISFSSLEVTNILSSDSIGHIISYILIVLILTTAFIGLIVINTNFISHCLSPYLNSKIFKLSLPVLICLGCFQLNAMLFPNSTHSYVRLLELGNSGWLAYLLVFIFILGISLVPILYLINIIKPHFKKIIIVGVSTSLFFSIVSFSSISKQDTNSNNKQNIIIIGIDSFRMDHMHDNMPFLDSKLKNSLSFTNSFTPFARTFPSWSTILSGEFPPNHGARFNLIDETLLNPKTKYLPQILAKNGYHTIYASDERRFSQIGKYHGFNKIVGPRTGLANLILGQYADFPLTNFLSLFSESSIIMPDIILNRAASNIYTPMNFSSALNDSLESVITDNNPIFLSVHYCMPHWPFNHGRKLKDFKETDEATPGYHESLKTVDSQISYLWHFLEENNLISNSIILFVSDHGETWQETLSFYTKKGEEITLNSNGHGSNVISDNEHRVLTAFYKNLNYKRVNLNKLITLADITPTLLNLVQIDSKATDGNDIFDSSTSTKYFPIESGFKVSAIAKKDIDINKAIEQSASRYKVRPNGTIRLKNEEMAFLNQGKRVGIRNENQLITYQRIRMGEDPSMILLDYNNMTIKELSESEASQDPLAKKLCEQYHPLIPDERYCNNTN